MSFNVIIEFKRTGSKATQQPSRVRKADSYAHALHIVDWDVEEDESVARVIIERD